MAIVKTENVTGVNPAPVPIASEVVTVREKLSLTAAQVANGNVLEMALLPAGCVPVGYKIRSADLDSGSPAITFDVGLVNAGETAISAAAEDGNSKWVTNSTLAQAGGLLLDTASAAAWAILGAVQAVSKNRIFGAVITAGAGTPAAGDFEVEFSYRSVN